MAIGSSIDDRNHSDHSQSATRMNGIRIIGTAPAAATQRICARTIASAPR